MTRALLSATAALLLAGGALARRAADPRSPLIVHEWGTFTSLQGSDGVGLEGLQHEEEALPPFVYSRTEVRDCPLRAHGYKGLEVPVSGVTQKMETPVIYFHTDVPRRVRVRVDFVGGLLTQWYPVSDLLGPPEAGSEDGPLDLASVGRSFLQWDVDLFPAGAADAPEVPFVLEEEPWALARQVRAATLQTVPRGAGRSGPTEAERYLFYRGLGSFSLPISVEARPGGAGTLENGGDQALPAAFALEIRGDVGRTAPLGAVAGGAAVPFDLGAQPFRPVGEVVAGLRGQVKGALTAEGLYADEAEAMVETWSRAWFASEGSRVLYLVPREITDELLPLQIDPAPDALVRVLVGRLEYATPEAEAEVLAALAARADPATRDAATQRLAALDRFLEPHLRRAMALSPDPLVQGQAAELLRELNEP